MPMTTFLNPADYLEDTSDSRVNSYLKELRNQTGIDWRIQEQKIQGRRKWLFWRRPNYSLFTVYVQVSGCEYQVLNYWLNHSWSINGAIDAEILVNWMIGYLAGIDHTKHFLKDVQALQGIDPNHSLPRIRDYVQTKAAA